MNLKRIIAKAAGTFLSENDSYVAYKKLLELDEKHDDDLAIEHVNVWDKFETSTVTELIELVETEIESLHTLVLDYQPDFLKNINWSLLKDQKDDILELITDLHYEAKQAVSAGETGIKDSAIQKASSLEGIVSLMDAIQDYAVDVLNKKEEEVFNIE